VNEVNETAWSQSTPVASDSPMRVNEGSYELKFLLPDGAADEILARARVHLAPDPHSDPALVDRYRITSLYFDTADLRVYHGLGSFNRRKFRLRRYGNEPRIFLERKSKSRGLVNKRRTPVPESELDFLKRVPSPELHDQASDSNLNMSWPGLWFQRRLARRQLLPKTQICYERTARVGMTPEGTIRLTVDRHIRCHPAADVSVPSLAGGVAALSSQSIVEFKFRVAMPALFKDLIHQLSLIPGSVSKYRLSVNACGFNGHTGPLAAPGDVSSNKDENVRSA
jgi:VTC domain